MTSDDNLRTYLEQRTSDGQVPAGAKRARDLLGAAATWADPPPEILDGVLAAIHARHATPAADQPSRRLPRRRLFTLAAGIAVFGVGGLTGWLATDLSDRERGTGVQLAGTELAPEATADGTVRDTPDGVAITLRVDRLAPAAPGTYYGAWVTGEGLEPVPIGSFHLRNGSEAIELWAGVDTAEYDTITVTIESEQDGPQSSGRVVLRGTIPGG